MGRVSSAVKWDQLDLNAQRLGEQWKSPHKHGEFTCWIESLAKSTLAEICEQLGHSVSANDEVTDLARKVSRRKRDLRTLFYLRAFCRRKGPGIQEYLGCSDSELCGRLKRLRSPLAALIPLVKDNIDHLRNIEALARWIAFPGGRKYSCARKVTKRHLDKLQKSGAALNEALLERSRDTTWTASIDRIYRIGRIALVTIQRQTADRRVREVGGRRRSKPATRGLARLEAGSHIVEVRNCAAFGETIIGWLASSIDRLEAIDEGAFEGFSQEAFDRALLRPRAAKDSRRPLTRLASRTSLTIGGPRVEVKSHHRGSDIRADLRGLVEGGVLRLSEPADIESMDLDFDGRDVQVNMVIESENYICRAVALDSKLTDQQRQRFAAQFLESTSFPLEQPIARGEERIHGWWAYDRVLASASTSHLEPGAEKYCEDLAELGVIKQEKFCRWRCSERHYGVAEEKAPDRCKFCREDVVEVKWDRRIVVNAEGLEQVVLAAIAKIPKVTVKRRRAERTIDGEKHQLVLLEVKKRPAYLYFAYGSVSQRFIKFFYRSQSPLLIVRVGTEGITSRLIEDSLYAEEPAGRILEACVGAHPPAAPPKLREAILRLRELALELQVTGGRRSAEDMGHALADPTEEYSDAFEDDGFNLLTWWMHTKEKWGKQFTGRALPEGIGGWRAGLPDPRNRTMAWDCKWSRDSKGYDLDMDEKRKASDYIKKLREQPHVKAFSGDLSVYGLICNKFQEGQLLGVAAYCRAGNQSWNGQIAFVDAEALLALYREWLVYAEELALRMDFFRQRLTKLLLEPSETFTFAHLTADKIPGLIQSVRDAPADPPGFQTEGLLELMR